MRSRSRARPARRWARTVIVAADGPGFLVNRCGRPFAAEALRLLQERIATHEQIDRICRLGGGFRMGPFELMDLVGIDVGFEVAKSFAELSFGEPRWRPSPLQARLVAAGRLGRKTGRGWYAYGDGPHRPEDPSPPAARGRRRSRRADRGRRHARRRAARARRDRRLHAADERRPNRRAAGADRRRAGAPAGSALPRDGSRPRSGGRRDRDRPAERLGRRAGRRTAAADAVRRPAAGGLRRAVRRRLPPAAAAGRVAASSS